MNENKPNLPEKGDKKPEVIERRVTLAKELNEQKEAFSFPGITDEAYQVIKEGENEFPGFATPIDEIIARCKEEGIKVVIVPGNNIETGTVHILPYGSNDIVNDNLFPRHLRTENVTDSRMKELIELDSISTVK